MQTKTLITFLIAASAAAVRCQQAAAPAPDATFTGAAGKIELRDYRGKQAVVLLFMRGFAKDMTCYYCGEQTREYLAQYAKLHAAGAEVLMVLPLATDIAGYVRKIGEGSKPPDPKLALPFPVVLDANGSACAAFHVPTVSGGTDPFPVSAPATFVIGKDGQMLFEHHGADPADRPEVAAVLEVLRTGKSKPVDKTAPAKAAVPARAWDAYADGMRAARSQRRPILLEFHAVW